MNPAMVVLCAEVTQKGWNPQEEQRKLLFRSLFLSTSASVIKKDRCNISILSQLDIRTVGVKASFSHSQKRTTRELFVTIMGCSEEINHDCAAHINPANIVSDSGRAKHHQ